MRRRGWARHKRTGALHRIEGEADGRITFAGAAWIPARHKITGPSTTVPNSPAALDAINRDLNQYEITWEGT